MIKNEKEEKGKMMKRVFVWLLCFVLACQPVLGFDFVGEESAQELPAVSIDMQDSGVDRGEAEVASWEEEIPWEQAEVVPEEQLVEESFPEVEIGAEEMLPAEDVLPEEEGDSFTTDELTGEAAASLLGTWSGSYAGSSGYDVIEREITVYPKSRIMGTK